MPNLMDLKKRLHHSDNAIIETPHSMSLSAFMETYFPSSFYLDTFKDADGKKYSLYNLLSGHGKGSISQRSRIFNGKYEGYKLASDILAILTIRREIWQQICINCAVQMAKADMPRLNALLIETAEAFGDKEFTAWVKHSLDTAPEEAFAAILVSLLGGNPQSFMPVFTGGKPLEEQLRYMEKAIPMMKRTFHKIIHQTSFDGDMADTYENYAVLLKPVTTLHIEGKYINYEHLLDTLYEFLKTETRKLIRITGPTGSEKNAITQLLYLKLCCDVRSKKVLNLAPCYINLSHYRRLGLHTREALQTEIRKDLTDFIEFCKNNTLRTPLLFVDGVKNYSLDEKDLGADYLLNDMIRHYLPKARLVVATENSVLPNRSRQRLSPQFASGEFFCQVNLNSLHLSDKQVAAKYLEQFKRIYASNLDYDITTKLMALFLDDKVDTYQLRMVLPFLEDADNINTLYHTICMDYLNGDSSEFLAAAQWAFHFSYTDRPLPEISPKVRELLSAHDSFLDYFCARFYMDKLRGGNSQDDIDQLNMVLPRSVTRFITPLLNESESMESRVLSLAKKSFRYMGTFAKIQLCYWLGRIKSPSMSLDAGDLLMEYYRAQKDLIDRADNSNSLAYLHQLFIYRGLGVSLMLQGRGDEIEREFFGKLMNNPQLNELNRAFPLNYYGDAPYLPAYDTMRLHDDTNLGKRTMDCLLAALERSRVAEELSPLFEFNLFTLCSLLQARMEAPKRDQTFDVVNYISQTKTFVEWYLDTPRLITPTLTTYLQMILQDFRSRLNTHSSQWSHIAADTYTHYQRRQKRTGWKDWGIPDAESVSEHTYSTWLLAKFLLPDSYPDEPDYNKAHVLELILLHGIAETLIGDVSKPVRDKNPNLYKELEEKEMAILFKRDTYPCFPSQQESAHIWPQWNAKNSFNGRLAHDLDLIQTMFQLLLYRQRHPTLIEKADFTVWMSERNKLDTPLGFEIYQLVIQQNKGFSKLLETL